MIGTDDGEKSQADGIGQLKPTFDRGGSGWNQCAAESEQENDHGIVVVGDPEQRVPIQKEIAERAAGKGRDERDREDTNEIQAVFAGEQDPEDARRYDGTEFNQVKHVNRDRLFTNPARL